MHIYIYIYICIYTYIYIYIRIGVAVGARLPEARPRAAVAPLSRRRAIILWCINYIMSVSMLHYVMLYYIVLHDMSSYYRIVCYTILYWPYIVIHIISLYVLV